MPERKLKVALKYCGSCNPQIDLSRIGRCLGEIVSKIGSLEVVPSTAADIDILVILCGCPRSCADREDIKGRGRHVLVIAGESLSGVHVSEPDLLLAVERELERVIVS